MKKMLMSLLVALLYFMTPAYALTDEQAMKAAQWAGYPATGHIEIVRDGAWPQGAFWIDCGESFINILDYENCTPYISVDQPEWMPDEWAYVILFHELGHWKQWRGGYIREMESVDREWQADVWGVWTAQAYGIDIMRAHDLWAWAVTEAGGDRCSYSHGCLLARFENLMTYGRLRAPVEAPWMD